jgi:PAS domain S-box-containing protein
MGRLNRAALIAGMVLVVAAVAGIYASFHFVSIERDRELTRWQVRLGIVSDSRAGAVSDWIVRQQATLRGLAENASLQLYLTELAMLGGSREAVTEARAQAQYLENLLTVTADRGGFALPALGPSVRANVERVGVAGLALTDAAGGLIVASNGMPPLAGALAELVSSTAKNEPAFDGPRTGAAGQPVVHFIQPVFSVQGDGGAADVVGRVIGVRLLDAEFFAQLKQPGDVEASGETYLVRAAGNSVEYLSPLADGTAPLKRRLARNTPNLAAAALLDNGGAFSVYRDYAGNDVLAVGRAIAGSDWMLVRKIDRAEALSESESRLSTMLTVLILIVVVVAVAIVAVWRHATSMRASEAAERYRRSTERLEGLSKFLRVVTDGQPTEIFAVDGGGRYTFANARAAATAGIEPEDMLGKPMDSVIGPARARPLERASREALEDHKRIERWIEIDDDGRRKIFKSDYIPLKPDAEYPPGVLITVQDMTELVEERERSAKSMRDLVSTCVSVVDQRDPFAAHHSVRVSEVAIAIAREMELDEDMVDTVDIAGALMNLGKVGVPSEVLTKTDRLTDEELAMVRQSVLTSAEMIRNVEFDGPVYETIRHIQEHWDGSGMPDGLAGEDIVVTARIVAVANAFVGMIESRADRNGMSFDRAAEILLQEAGKRFDRRVVVALLNHLDNHGGRRAWAQFSAPPAED